MESAYVPETKPAPRAALCAAGGLLVLAAALAYANSLGGPFVFDDTASIVANPTIRHLWPLSPVLHPPIGDGLTVAGRPLLNLSFAFNYALGGLDPRGYHAVNLAIHLFAGLTLFGLVRRTLLRPALAARFGAASTALALGAAAIWILHPLQTESVTYVAQRAESLGGLCILLTLYGFVRSTEPATGRGWAVRGWVACLLGMAVKETVVVAPLLVLLYDRTFVAGSFREAWRRHGRQHLALFATWLLLAWLVAGTGNRGGSVAFGTAATAWTYALTQCDAIFHYLRLAVWPHPLVFDYGLDLAHGLGEVAPQAIALAALLGATLWALVRRPVWGFVGAWFFLLLAPSSSFVPVTSQPMAEHRMYLPLAAVAIAVVPGLYAWLGRRGLWLTGGLAVVAGIMTWQRNEIYRSELTLWTDTVTKRPDNPRAQNNLGNALESTNRRSAAIVAYKAALRLRPDYTDALNNLGFILSHTGRGAEALPYYEAAAKAKPSDVTILTNLGSALTQLHRTDEAIAVYERALALAPQSPDTLYNLGNALFQLGRTGEAIGRYAVALQLKPDFADARTNLVAAHLSFAEKLLTAHRDTEAIPHYEAAVHLQPDAAALRYNLANLLLGARRFTEAAEQYEVAVRLAPDNAGAHHNLALALVALGRTAHALPHYEAALRLVPGSAAAHHNYAFALAQLGRRTEAIAEEEKALRLQPDFPAARAQLQVLQNRP